MSGRPTIYDGPMERIMVSIPPKIRSWLDDKAKEAGASMSHIVRRLLEAAIAQDQGEQ